ncbi:MAG: UTP--glucose-1-phosphate uridylyltransferase [Deltaproteobacteria bacterium]|nr:UTP--glucose-1-phosphate uridylyltransferase [Deltaproteobacteria bacterium]
MSEPVKKVVIPVAGLGTRGLPFTKEVPKELLPIIDIPTIHFIAEECLSAGIEQIIFVTSKGKHTLEDYFDLSPNLEIWLRKRGKEALADKVRKIGSFCEVMSVRQKEPLGLGHAVYCARHMIGNEKFAVCLGDEIFPPWDVINRTQAPLKRLVDAAVELNSSTVGVVEIPIAHSPSYGMLDLGGKELGDLPLKVLRTVEKPKPEVAPSRYAIIGRYVFDSSLFDALRDTQPGIGGEIQLTDAMDKLCAEGKLHGVLLKGCRYDIGNPLYYLKAQIDLALRRPELSQSLRDYMKSL